MIDKMYYYFIKTKYGTYTQKEVHAMAKVYAQLKPLGLNGSVISKVKKAGIEMNLIGKVLSEEERKTDNFTLKENSILESFMRDELLKEEEEGLVSLSVSVENIRKEIISNLSAAGLYKAKQAGLI